jgi:hypothetical protein
MGPLVTLAPNDSTTMTQNWFAARSLGPVLAVNDAGLITSKLTVQQSHDTARLQGTYGIFYQGNVKSIFKNASGTTVSVADSYAVSPSDSFAFKDSLKVVAGASKLLLALYSAGGGFIGNLDSIAVTPVADIKTIYKNRTADNRAFSLYQKGNVLSIDVRYEGRYSIEVLGLDGRPQASFRGTKLGMYSVPVGRMIPGIYLVKVSFPEVTESRIVFVP